MIIRGCSAYNIDVHIKKQDNEFSYQYVYQDHNFEGNVIIKAVSDPVWIEAVFQMILENEIEQYELDRLAEKYIGKQGLS